MIADPHVMTAVPHVAGLAVPHVAGLLGALCYVANYTRLTLGLTTADRANYFAVNLCAALLVLFSLAYAFNPAAAVIQTFFIAVSVVGLYSRLRRRSRGGRDLRRSN